MQEASTVKRFQQQLEEHGKLEMGNRGEKLCRGRLETIKRGNKEAAEQTIGYQPKPDRRGWFDDECCKALEEKNAPYKKWIDRPTRAKRMEYERLRKISHKICKNRKRMLMDNHIRDIKENIKDIQIRNAYKEVGSLKASFQPHTDLC